MRAVIFANGVINNFEAIRGRLSDDDLLIAADGGTHHLKRLGLFPGVVVGDLDSIDPDDISRLESLGVQLSVHPRDKDQTDLELALDYAVRQGAQEILLFGLLGGRLDQTLANLLLLTMEKWGQTRLRIVDGLDSAVLIRKAESINLPGKAGDLVSLIPLTAEVSGVSTQGLRWPLHQATLTFGSTLAVSNEMVSEASEISIREGLLLIVHRSIE